MAHGWLSPSDDAWIVLQEKELRNEVDGLGGCRVPHLLALLRKEGIP